MVRDTLKTKTVSTMPHYLGVATEMIIRSE